MKRLHLALACSFVFFCIGWGYAVVSVISLPHFESYTQTWTMPHEFMFMSNLSLMFATMYKYGGLENFSKELVTLRTLVVLTFVGAIALFREQSLELWEISYLVYFAPFAMSNYILLVYSQPARLLHLSSGEVYASDKRWGEYLS